MLFSRRVTIAATASLAIAAAPAMGQSLAYADLSTAGEMADSSTTGEPASTPAEAQPASEEHRHILQYALLDRLEWAAIKGEDGYAWDFSAFIGGETDRLWVASTGEGSASLHLDYLELQALYSHAVTDGWDLQAGLRFDAIPHPNRWYGVLGSQADVTDQLWLGGFIYFSNKSELSARFTGQYNLPLTRRLILQPSWELDAYASDIPELGIGRGLSYAEAGLRLRYEIKPTFAPYIGISWDRSLGRTARIARAAGDDPETRSLVFGLRSEY